MKLTPKNQKKLKALPAGAGYCVPIPVDVLSSFAWRALSKQGRMLLEALMIEHGVQYALCNGALKMPYNQLDDLGMRRGSILDAIFESDALGLIAARRGERSSGIHQDASTYRLTWLPYLDGESVLPATNEWKAIKSAAQAMSRVSNAKEALKRERALKRARRIERAEKTTKPRPEKSVSPVTFSAFPSDKDVTLKRRETA